MDDTRFDRLARSLGASRSRRAAVGALLSGVLLPLLLPEPGADAAGKGRRRGKGKDRGKGGGEDRGGAKKGTRKERNRRRGGAGARATAEAVACFPGTTCAPRPGANLAGCDFTGSSALKGADCAGCNLGRTGLRRADASGANLAGANASGALYCRTVMPDGSVNTRDCAKGTSCCPTCDDQHPCRSGQVCCAGTCRAGDCCGNAECTDPAKPVCAANTCVPCTGNAQCGARKLCQDGACRACDVCAAGCAFSSVQAAINATNPQLSTIRVCPGTYAENGRAFDAVEIRRPLTLVGAGDGADPATNTIIRPAFTDWTVVSIQTAGTVRLEGLRITGGSGLFHNRDGGHGVIAAGGALTLASCTVTDNHTSDAPGAGVAIYLNAQATFLNTRITNNSSQLNAGGGVDVQNSTATFDALSRVTGNSAFSIGGIRALGSGAVALPSADNVTGNTPNDCGGNGTFTGPGAVCTAT